MNTQFQIKLSCIIEHEDIILLGIYKGNNNDNNMNDNNMNDNNMNDNNMDNYNDINECYNINKLVLPYGYLEHNNTINNCIINIIKKEINIDINNYNHNILTNQTINNNHNNNNIEIFTQINIIDDNIILQTLNIETNKFKDWNWITYYQLIYMYKKAPYKLSTSLYYLIHNIINKTENFNIFENKLKLNELRYYENNVK